MTGITLINGSSYQATPCSTPHFPSSGHHYAKTNDRAASTFVTSVKHSLDYGIVPNTFQYPAAGPKEPSLGLKPGFNAPSARILQVSTSTVIANNNNDRAHRLGAKNQKDAVPPATAAAGDEPPQLDSSPISQYSLPSRFPSPPRQRERQGQQQGQGQQQQQQQQQTTGIPEGLLIAIIVAVCIIALLVATCCWFAFISGSITFNLLSSRPRNVGNLGQGN
ncbi:hypothetical protein PG993_013010 [Apiospora rasikravindrae]|uniref:Uncharacterized protein n=1 Tax=Apiospora rasikravindrae TaxID=990691 RepID=A0ABR1RWK4_9PEZI